MNFGLMKASTAMNQMDSFGQFTTVVGTSPCSCYQAAIPTIATMVVAARMVETATNLLEAARNTTNYHTEVLYPSPRTKDCFEPPQSEPTAVGFQTHYPRSALSIQLAPALQEYSGSLHLDSSASSS